MPQFQLPGRPGSRLSPFQIIILGFAGIILTGALLLITPLAAADGRAASFSDALFTSVSAVCVTGLVVCDTATRWSAFGQAVILVLIQIGGLGVVTAAAMAVNVDQPGADIVSFRVEYFSIRVFHCCFSLRKNGFDMI